MMAEPNSQTETLQKLERLTHLETMVAEQRIRIEKYRTMYETLKTEHVQLQDAKSKRDNELINLQEETQSLQTRFQGILNQAMLDRDKKTQECEELRTQILTPQKMEVLRVKLQEEIESSYKQKLETADLELDKYRSDFNKLRYEYSFLKSEYEHQQAKNKTIIDELKGHHQIELDILTKDKEDLLEQLRKHDDQNDAQRIRMLQKDNTQLNLKVKSLLDELDDIREKREASGLQSDHVSRLQARQLTELSSHCKALETEKDALKSQIERVQAELERSNKQQESFSHQAMKLERENLQQKSYIEEITHHHKVEINNIKLSLTKDKGELERDRDALKSELQTSKNKITVLEQNLLELKNSLSKKEEEIVLRVQQVKEEEWEKLSKLENYKLKAESQLADADRQKADLDMMHKVQIEKLEEKLKDEIEKKDQLERNLSTVKSQILQQKNLNDQLDELKRQHQELKTKYQSKITEYESLLTDEQETNASNEKLKHKLELLEKELKLSQEDMQKQQEGFQRAMQDVRKKIESEKKENDKEIESVKKQLNASEKKVDKISLMAKKKHSKQKKIIVDLSKKLEVEKAKNEKNELEKNTLMKNLNLEHERTKRMLERLRKRQNQFNNLLNMNSVAMPNLASTNIMQTPLLGMSFEPLKEPKNPLLDSLNPSPIPPMDDFIKANMEI